MSNYTFLKFFYTFSPYLSPETFCLELFAMKLLLLTLTLLVRLVSPSSDFESAVLLLSGASSMEELDEAEVARYEALSRSPLPLNSASAARMRASGLLSTYQIAVILDARERGGSILSISELALLDGFSEPLARALSSFISLDAASLGMRKQPLQQSLTLGGTFKAASGESSSNFRFKYLCSKSGRWEAGVRNSSAGLAYYGRRHLSKLIVGDFNARFGQGLVMWSGFSLSGLSANLSRNPTGVSASHSYSSSSALRGAASEWTFGQRNRLSVIGFVKESKLIPAANFSHLGLRGEWGITALGTGLLSTDLRWSPGKFDLFCEAAYDFKALSSSASSPETSANPAVLGGFAALAGIVWNPRYATKLSLLGRWYPSIFAGTYSGSVRSSTKVSDEAGVTLAFQSSSLTLVAEAVKRSAAGYSQCRALAQYSPSLEGPWTCSFRLSERVRSDKSPAFRTDLRADTAYKIGNFSAALRANALLYKDLAWLGYSELSYRGPDARLKCSAFARFTMFNVKNWDDRIYAYEHDALGYFTVPAYYGRGYALSFYTSLKFRPFLAKQSSAPSSSLSYMSSSCMESSSAVSHDAQTSRASSSDSLDSQPSRTSSAFSRYFFRGSYSLSLRCSWLQRRVGDSSIQSTLTLRLQLAIEL